MGQRRGLPLLLLMYVIHLRNSFTRLRSNAAPVPERSRRRCLTDPDCFALAKCQSGTMVSERALTSSAGVVINISLGSCTLSLSFQLSTAVVVLALLVPYSSDELSSTYLCCCGLLTHTSLSNLVGNDSLASTRACDLIRS